MFTAFLHLLWTSSLLFHAGYHVDISRYSPLCYVADPIWCSMSQNWWTLLNTYGSRQFDPSQQNLVSVLLLWVQISWLGPVFVTNWASHGCWCIVKVYRICYCQWYMSVYFLYGPILQPCCLKRSMSLWLCHFAIGFLHCYFISFGFISGNYELQPEVYRLLQIKQLK